MPTLTRVLITLCLAVAATVAWQAYGNAARKIIASRYPQLGWLAPRTAPLSHSSPDAIGLATQAVPPPDLPRFNAISLDLDAVRQNIDRIGVTQEQTTRNIEQLTAGQERMTRNIDQLTAGEERMTREITKLQTMEQQTHHKNSEPAPRTAPAPARKLAPRAAQAPTVR
jgi:hypothetical protein